MKSILTLIQKACILLKGGAGSGNFGHEGRPGVIGGSGGSGGGGGSESRGRVAERLKQNIEQMRYPGAKIQARVSDRVPDAQGNDSDGVIVTVGIKPERGGIETKSFYVRQDEDKMYSVQDPDSGETNYVETDGQVAGALRSHIESFNTFVRGSN